VRYVIVAVSDDDAREELGQRLEDVRDIYPLTQWEDVSTRWNAIVANVEQLFGHAS